MEDYNIKILHYPETGETTVLTYEKRIGSSAGASSDHDNSRREDIDPELREVLDQMNIRRSLRHTKQEMMKYARANRWEYWLTLTFDPKKVDRESYEICIGKFQNFMRKLKGKSPGIGYMTIPEIHPQAYKKEGRITWHIHVLMLNLDNSLLSESGYVKVDGKTKKRDEVKSTENYKTLYNLPDWTWGWSVVEKLDAGSSAQAANYALNAYITKDLITHTKHKKRFFTSQNLKKAEEYTLQLHSPREKLNFYNLMRPYMQLKPKVSMALKTKERWEEDKQKALEKYRATGIMDFSITEQYFQRAVYYELKDFNFDSPDAIQDIVQLMQPTLPPQRDIDNTEQEFIFRHVLH